MAKINKKTKFMNNVKFNKIKLIKKNENKPQNDIINLFFR